MFTRLKARFARTALGPVVVIWGFGYLLVDIFAFLMGRTGPGVQFLLTLPFLVSGVALTLLLDRLRRRSWEVFPSLRWGALIVALLVAAAVQARLDLQWFRWLGQVFFPHWLPWADQVTMQRFLTTFVLYLWTFCLALTVIWAAGLSKRAEANEARAEQAEAEAARAEAEAARAEAAALRLQLNPHFLFNTLNSLSSLVTLGRKDEAEAMIQALGDFLRASLHADPMADVSLDEEIETIDAYLGIESMRFGDRLGIEIDIAPGLGEARVPNFILQPLVENAIKHGVAAAGGRAKLKIAAARVEGGVVLSVTNGRDGAAGDAEPRPGTGIGLANIRQRLAIRYGARARLDTGPTAHGWRAEIRLPEERG
ncbi:MAG TPA: histidine kinase [Allosphingosinicella sp.]|nr:histidine kinase [Allosphingosinicella sp.]